MSCQLHAAAKKHAREGITRRGETQCYSHVSGRPLDERFGLTLIFERFSYGHDVTREVDGRLGHVPPRVGRLNPRHNALVEEVENSRPKDGSAHFHPHAGALQVLRRLALVGELDRRMRRPLIKVLRHVTLKQFLKKKKVG